MTDIPPSEPFPDAGDDPDAAEGIALAEAILDQLVKRGIEPTTALIALTIAWTRIITAMEIPRERFKWICEGLEGVIYGTEGGGSA